MQAPQGLFHHERRHPPGGQDSAEPFNLFLKGFRVQGGQGNKPAAVTVGKPLSPLIGSD